MLLRSSSTPVIGTLLSAFSDSPNRDFDNLNNNNNNSNNNGCTKHSPIFYHSTTKLSSSHGVHHLNLNSFSCSSSPISLSASGFSEFDRQPNSLGLGRFRRTRSDGNLKGLTTSSCDIDEFCNPNTPTRCSPKPHKAMLKTAPSFSIFNSVDEFEGEEENDEVVKRDGCLERSITIGDHIEAIGSGEFSFGKDNNMGLIKEDENEEKEEAINGFQSLGIEGGVEPVSRAEPVSPSMYLATGLGIDGAGFGGGGGGGYFGPAKFDESDDVEEYYKRMVVQDPCNPLFVRNYAQLLQSKGDLHGAEEYYFRATLADPGDGEILLQYAKLVWELHHDQDRALSYFERAAQAAPEDSYAHAAYASFLWEIEDGKAEDNTGQGHIQIEEEEVLNELHKSAYKEENEPVSPSLHLAAGLGIDVAGFDGRTGVVDFITDSSEGGIVEEYYKRMVEENPCNPLFLRNYAQFLCQSKGDLQGAKEFYSRAILADPGDGEIMSQYAKLVWELHHNRDKALVYFEQAVQATPGDSHILAAYASFLWETEDEEEEHSIREDQIQVPLFRGGVMTSANA